MTPWYHWIIKTQLNHPHLVHGHWLPNFGYRKLCILPSSSTMLARDLPKHSKYFLEWKQKKLARATCILMLLLLWRNYSNIRSMYLLKLTGEPKIGRVSSFSDQNSCHNSAFWKETGAEQIFKTVNQIIMHNINYFYSSSHFSKLMSMYSDQKSN